MGPSGWVFAYDFAFEVVFALITLAIAFFSFKIYSFTSERQLRNFGLSFLSISASFAVLALFNLGLPGLITKITSPFLSLEEGNIVRVVLAGHMGLYIIGVITLAYMTLKVKSEKTYYLLLALTFLSIIAATHKLYLFYSIASVLFGSVALHYGAHYFRKKSVNKLLVFLGFSALTVANLVLVFSVTNAYYYKAGHFLQLGGYSLLLINLVRMLK